MDPLIKDLLGKTQLPWLLDRTIYVTRAGSHCYGLNTPQSDLDVRGIAIPPKEYFMGYLKHFEQADKFQNSELDACIYDLRKFIKIVQFFLTLRKLIKSTTFALRLLKKASEVVDPVLFAHVFAIYS